MPPVDTDTAALLADLETSGLTVAVTFAGTAAAGLWDHEAREVLEGPGPGPVANEKAVHVQASALPGLAAGEAITVDGTAYTIREVRPYDDGGMILVSLRDPA